MVAEVFELKHNKNAITIISDSRMYYICMSAYLNKNVLSVLLHAGSHKFIDQFIILVTLAPRFVETDVMRIVPQLLVISAHVDSDRQALVRFNASQSCIKR